MVLVIRSSMKGIPDQYRMYASYVLLFALKNDF